MKLLVCIAKTPDTTTKIDFTDDKKSLKDNDVQYILNPYDEWYSLVRAIELKEANPNIEIHLLNLCDASSEPVIRKALALGGDKAFRINTQPDESSYTAYQIAEFVKKQNAYDIIFTGKEAIDYNSGLVGSMMAEMLSIQYFNDVSKLEIQNQKAVLDKQIEGGIQKIEADFPVVLSVQKGLAEQRIPNMKGIIQSRSKTIEVIEPVQAEKETEIISMELPPSKKSVKMIDPDNPKELIDLLHKEAKVI